MWPQSEPACAGTERTRQGDVRGQHPFSITCPTRSPPGLSVAVPIHPQLNRNPSDRDSWVSYLYELVPAKFTLAISIPEEGPTVANSSSFSTEFGSEAAICPFGDKGLRKEKREKVIRGDAARVTRVLPINSRHFLKFWL